MEALGAAAAAVERMDEEYELAMDPIDMEEERGRHESDDEEGPPAVDDDTDALPPGDVIHDGDAVETTGIAAQEADPAIVQSIVPPPLPVDVKMLKVEELKQHLMWRDRSRNGNKAELQARLQQAIDTEVELLSLEAFRSRYGAGTAQAQAATAAAQWEPVDPSSSLPHSRARLAGLCLRKPVNIYRLPATAAGEENFHQQVKVVPK